MGYRHIDNLYKHPNFLYCYALEKIHGTSANLSFKDGNVAFFAGGASHDVFVKLFDKDALLERFNTLFPANEEGVRPEVTVYGEAFGGKMQGMSHVYGPVLRFMAFEVKINEKWTDVPYGESIVKSLGLEYVPYEKGPLTIEWLDEQRDRDSLVATTPGQIREGVVIRQVYESPLANGGRHIYKHKRSEFMETKTPRTVSLEELQVLTNAKEISDEWVTAERLRHVLDKTPYNGPEDTGRVIKAMVEDVRRESEGEVEWSKAVEKAISKATAQLIHNPEIQR